MSLADIPDDNELLRRARQFDHEALTQIHQRYYAAIFRYVVLRVGERASAEDLTADVFVRFLAALRGQRPPDATLRGWLYGVAAHVVADHHRRGQRYGGALLDDAVPSPATAPADLAEASALRADLRAALQALTDEQQQVIALRFGSELPIQDVARALGKSEGAVKQLQLRAVAALARLMHREEPA